MPAGAARGPLAASNRLIELLRQATANGRRPAWALRLDVASFFPSIHKRTLLDLVAKRVRHPELRWLTEVVLFHDPTTNYRFRSLDGRVAPPGSADYPVPARKSLFGKANQSGLPIGNLTSQFWANVYLNELDQFAKRRLGCRWYARYVDDLVLLASDPRALREWRVAIEDFLAQRLRLALRTEQLDPVPVSRGVDFVGWRTWWSHRVPRRRTLANLRRRLAAAERRCVHRAFGDLARRIEFGDAQSTAKRRGSAATAVRVAALPAVLASYAGHLRRGAAWTDAQRVWRRYPWLSLLFTRAGWRVSARWGARWPAARRFGTLYRQMLRHLPDGALLFLRVGRYVEFYGPQRLLAEHLLQLRAVPIERAGYALTAGFPAWLEARFAERALRAGAPIIRACRAVGSDPGRGVRTSMLLFAAGEPSPIASPRRAGAPPPAASARDAGACTSARPP